MIIIIMVNLQHLNTLAIPKEDYRFSMDKKFDKIIDSLHKPKHSIKKQIK